MAAMVVCSRAHAHNYNELYSLSTMTNSIDECTQIIIHSVYMHTHACMHNKYTNDNYTTHASKHAWI